MIYFFHQIVIDFIIEAFRMELLRIGVGFGKKEIQLLQQYGMTTQNIENQKL